MVERWSWKPLRAADRRPVPRGAGDAAQRRQAPSERTAVVADDSLRSTRRAPGRPRARRRRRLRSSRVRARPAAAPTSSPSTTPSSEVAATRATFAAMAEAGEIAEERFVGGLQGDATRLPFADCSFDRVITSEVLEHIQADMSAIAEFVRVLKPGGTFAATVPTWLPEKINWMLSDEYHAPEGRRRTRSHLQRHRVEGQAARRGPGRHRQPSRARVALAVLVVEVRGGRAPRRQPHGQRVPADARVGDRQATAQHEGGRACGVAGARQELHRLRPEGQCQRGDGHVTVA